MNSTANNFCYLKAVEFDNADDENEEPRCQVSRQNASWVLEAITNPGSDADARCSAYCNSRN